MLVRTSLTLARCAQATILTLAHACTSPSQIGTTYGMLEANIVHVVASESPLLRAADSPTTNARASRESELGIHAFVSIVQESCNI